MYIYSFGKGIYSAVKISTFLTVGGQKKVCKERNIKMFSLLLRTSTVIPALKKEKRKAS